MGVEYDSGLGRWSAYRDGVQIWTFIDLGFQSGAMAACGAEGSDPTVPLAVQCDMMQYRPVGQSWISYDYNNVQIDGNCCVYKPNQYGAIGSGPCYRTVLG